MVERYFALGDDADQTADHYLEHYYGPAYFVAVRADTPTTPAGLAAELERLRAAGSDDVILLPCSDRLSQVEQLADTLDDLGIRNESEVGRALGAQLRDAQSA